MGRESVRIRLIPRFPVSNAKNPREAFWLSMGHENDDYDGLEGKLCREFGPALRRVLIGHISEPLRATDVTFSGGQFGDIEHFLFRYFDRLHFEKEWRHGQELDALVRLLEQRHQFISESPGLRATNEKVAAAGSIIFAARVAGYSSLSLDLSVGPIKKVVEVFDGDFDGFRVFLEAFVPQAYSHVFSYSEAERANYDVQMPTSFAKSFSMARIQSLPVAIPEQQTSVAASSAAREKAEWLWKLANGSLLLPVVLSLVVLYLGMTILHDIGKSQQTLMAPIFEHQMKLLEEDRRRIFKENTPSSTPTNSSSVKKD